MIKCDSQANFYLFGSLNTTTIFFHTYNRIVDYTDPYFHISHYFEAYFSQMNISCANFSHKLFPREAVFGLDFWAVYSVLPVFHCSLGLFISH